MDLTDGEMALIESVRTADEWAMACRSVKRARGGSYPPDWYRRVIASGLLKRVSARFGGTATIKVKDPLTGETVSEIDVTPES